MSDEITDAVELYLRTHFEHRSVRFDRYSKCVIYAYAGRHHILQISILPDKIKLQRSYFCPLGSRITRFLREYGHAANCDNQPLSLLGSKSRQLLYTSEGIVFEIDDPLSFVNLGVACWCLIDDYHDYFGLLIEQGLIGDL